MKAHTYTHDFQSWSKLLCTVTTAQLHTHNETTINEQTGNSENIISVLRLLHSSKGHTFKETSLLFRHTVRYFVTVALVALQVSTYQDVSLLFEKEMLISLFPLKQRENIKHCETSCERRYRHSIIICLETFLFRHIMLMYTQ